MYGLVEDQFWMPNLPGDYHRVLYLVAPGRAVEVLRHYSILGVPELIRQLMIDDVRLQLALLICRLGLFCIRARCRALLGVLEELVHLQSGCLLMLVLAGTDDVRFLVSLLQVLMVHLRIYVLYLQDLQDRRLHLG